MVDNTNPTSQFHPYQPPEMDSQKTTSPTGLSGMLGKLGIDTSKLGSLGSSDTVNNARTFAKNNGAMVLGGLAAAAIGAGLLRKRGMRTS